MKKHKTFLPAIVLVLAAGTAVADGHDEIAAEVIALTRAQWAAEMERAGADQIMRDVADDYTEFNPVTPVRVEGKTMARSLLEANLKAPGNIVFADMANPHVQVYGDTAILTYNFIGKLQEKDGNIEDFFAKSTRVYVRMDGSWKMVHANFAPLNPPGN